MTKPAAGFCCLDDESVAEIGPEPYRGGFQSVVQSSC